LNFVEKDLLEGFPVGLGAQNPTACRFNDSDGGAERRI
jgi:hypothetical protein